MLYRPPQIHFFLSEVLDWLLSCNKEWSTFMVVVLLLRSLVHLIKHLFGTSTYYYVPKSRRNKVTYKLNSWFKYTIKPIILYIVHYMTKATQYEYWVPRKRKSPQERQAISQRPRKLKSRFYYRRSKKGGQVCSTRTTTMPRGLRRLVTWRDPSRQSVGCASTSSKRDATANRPRATSTRGCTQCTSRQCRTAARFHALPAMDAVRKPREPTKLDSDSFIIAVDNCCTTSVTNNLKDFIEPPKDRKTAVSGMGGTILATARGTVRWKIEDDDGKVHSIVLKKVLYAPDAPFRLLSPQHWSQQADDNYPQKHGTWCATYDDTVVLQWQQRSFTKTIAYCTRTNVGKFRSAPGHRQFTAFCSLLEKEFEPNQCQPVTSFPTVVSDDEDEEDENAGYDSDAELQSRFPGEATETDVREEGVAEDETIPEPTIFDMNFEDGEPPHLVEDDENENKELPEQDMLRMHYRLGHLSFNKMKVMSFLGILPKSYLQCKTPKCAACIYGKATRKAWRTKGKQGVRRIKVAKEPGECVSVDQMESPTAGFVAQMKGKLTKGRYKYATIYIDHYSRQGFVYLQRSLSSAETLESKRAFERYSKQHGVRIRHYHADNGRFADNLFRNDVAEKGQTISYCGVNAHWQNGIAEKRIRDLTDQARTILLFAQSRWPGAVSTHLWPYALRAANDSLNNSPRLQDKVIPSEAFTKQKTTMKVRQQHTFGCPVFALNNKLQGGKYLSRWSSHARIGIYLGMSPQHARSVALVLNIKTGLVSPQFHVEFDDLFERVSEKAGNKQVDSRWQVLSGLRAAPKQPTLTVTPPGVQGVVVDPFPDEADIPDTEIIDDSFDEPFPSDDWNDSGAPMQPQPTIHADESPGLGTQEGVRRSTRTRQPTQRMLESVEQESLALAFQHDETMEKELQLQDDMADPIAFAASSDPDNMYLHEAMKAPDKKQFMKAMVKEVDSHQDNEHWELKKRSSIPAGKKVLPAVWAMKRKRRIATREIYKWKARLNIHGGKQTKGVDYWETYSPMVTWNAIRMFMTLAMVNGWHTRQLDFVLAYPQADVECDMYMEIPRGFKLPRGKNPKEYALKLRRNLYGSRQASRVWSQYLTKGLKARGFVQSTIDECVFYRGKLILMIYVDDCILMSPNNQDIDDVISLLQKSVGGTRPFNITDEGDIADYLGVKVEKLDDGTMTLTQPHLIDQIISDLGLKENTKIKDLPALSSRVLNKDVDGKPFKETWNYRSLVGKINFLEKSTRPELAYASHQCARFSSDPKDSHAQAIKQIGRYLMGTRDKGIILKPNPDMGLEDWVDADFCGNWDRKYALEDPTTA